MRSDLAIRIHLVQAYAILLIVFLAVITFFKLELYWHFLFIIFLLIPESIMTGMIFYFSKRKKLLVTVFGILAVQLLLLFFYIKQFRALFLPATVRDSEIIAFTQFSGYPFWFDLIIFFVLLFTPLICVGVYRLSRSLQHSHD